MSDQSAVAAIAYSWRCPDCDYRNFGRSVAHEPTTERIHQFMEQYSKEEWERRSHDLVPRPNRFTCEECGHEWNTSDDSNQVPLIVAYVQTCDECGCDHFEVPEIVEMGGQTKMYGLRRRRLEYLRKDGFLR